MHHYYGSDVSFHPWMGTGKGGTGLETFEQRITLAVVGHYCSYDMVLTLWWLYDLNIYILNNGQRKLLMIFFAGLKNIPAQFINNPKSIYNIYRTLHWLFVIKKPYT